MSRSRRRIPADVRRGLAARGHELEVQGDFCSCMGGGQAVMRKDGVNYGASDPRKDGAAVPEPVTETRNRKSGIESEILQKNGRARYLGPPVSILTSQIFVASSFQFCSSPYHLN